MLAALVAREVGGGAARAGDRCGVHRVVRFRARRRPLRHDDDVRPAQHDRVLGWLVIRAVVRAKRPVDARRRASWSGSAAEAKPQVAFVAVVVVATLLVARPAVAPPVVVDGRRRRRGRRARGAVRRLAAAARLAAADRRRQHRRLGRGRPGRVHPVPARDGQPAARPGLGRRACSRPFRRAELRPLRFVPLTYAVLAVAYIVGNGKAYYLASLYPLLLGLGALPTADWTLRSRDRTCAARSAAIAVSAAVGALIALPLLPERSLQGSVVIAAQSRPGRDGRLAAVRRDGHRAPGKRIPASERRAHRDLHRELRRGRRDRPARTVTRPAACLQRPQRLQRVGAPPGRDTHALVDRVRRRVRRGSRLRPAAARLATGRTTASASTTTSRASRCSSAGRPPPGRRSGRPSLTSTDRERPLSGSPLLTYGGGLGGDGRRRRFRVQVARWGPQPPSGRLPGPHRA